MHPVSCTNTYHNVIDLENHGGCLKIQNVEYLENRTYLFYEIRKFLTCALDNTFSEVFVL